MAPFDDTEVPPGTVVGGCRILAVAGRGGMGVVYRAQQIDLDRPVALKLIASRLADDAAFRERFVRESRATAAIDHPNVIPVYAAGEDGGRLYLAMRFVDGEDLRARVRARGPLAPADAAKLAAHVVSALDVAHERGLVHRDVKPANVLLDGDHPYLTDFGLTKRVDGETTMTGSGRWVGTLGYIAPEQIRSLPVDARTDVYALGCLLHFMLTGDSPYRRDSDEATLYAHLNDPPPDVTTRRHEVPPALGAVITRALAKDPADRYPSAGDLGAAALAAVGAASARPERVVARGAAAPAGAVEGQTLVAGPTPEPPAAETVTPDAPTRQAPPGGAPSGPRGPRRWSRRLTTAVIATIVVVAGVAIALLKLAGDDRPGESAVAAGPPRIVAGKAIKVDSRPNAVTFAFGRVWVTSARSRRLTGIDPDGERGKRILATGRRLTSVAGGFGALWLTSGVDHQLLRVDPGSLRITKTIDLPRSEAAAVATDARWVWVALRPPGEIVSSIVRVDPRTGATERAEFGEEGISGLDAGGGRVWIPNRRRDRLSTLRPGSLERKSSATVGSGPRGVAWGKGYAWVTSDSEDVVSRVPRSLFNVRRIPVCRSPIGVAVGDPGVWVACNLSDEVWLLRPDGTEMRTELKARVGANPFAIAAEGNRAWVTNVSDGTITPLRAVNASG